jgi:eukaryotic-like serine/threonine-protein kinase
VLQVIASFSGELSTTSGVLLIPIVVYFALRDRVSTRERFNITGNYYDFAVGDLQQSREIYELWAQTYPQDPGPRDALGNVYIFLGLYPQALEALLEERRLARGEYYNYGNLVVTYISLNRLQEARLTVEEALAHKLDPVDGYDMLYRIDFLERNGSGMQADVAWAAGKTALEAWFLRVQSDAEAYWGHPKKAWDLSQRAVMATRRENKNEVAGINLAYAAVRETEFGNSVRAGESSDAALSLSHSRDVKRLAALALARAGSADRTKNLADELSKRYLFTV